MRRAKGQKVVLCRACILIRFLANEPMRKLSLMETMTSTTVQRSLRRFWQRNSEPWKLTMCTWRVRFSSRTWWRTVWRGPKHLLRPLQLSLVRHCYAQCLVRCQAFSFCQARQPWTRTMRKRRQSTWALWTTSLPENCLGICPSLMVKLSKRLVLSLGWARPRMWMQPRKH